MLEMDLIQTRGFHNLLTNGTITGFQFCVRLTYYRGIFLSQLRPQKVIVDGEIFPREKIVWNIKGNDYQYGQMKAEGNVHWSPTETAVLKIAKSGGLSQGYHEISTGYKFSSSYIPPSIQQSLDSEERDHLLEILFGQLFGTRKLLLVW